MQDLQREEMYCRNRSSSDAEVGEHWALSSEHWALLNIAQQWFSLSSQQREAGSRVSSFPPEPHHHFQFRFLGIALFFSGLRTSLVATVNAKKTNQTWKKFSSEVSEEGKQMVQCLCGTDFCSGPSVAVSRSDFVHLRHSFFAMAMVLSSQLWMVRCSQPINTPLVWVQFFKVLVFFFRLLNPLQNNLELDVCKKIQKLTSLIGVRDKFLQYFDWFKYCASSSFSRNQECFPMYFSSASSLVRKWEDDL